MYLLKKNETKEYVNATAIVYLTNLHHEVAVVKKELEIGKLQKDKTEEIEIDMQMKNKSYGLEILVFENDLLKIKGNGGITVHAYNAGGKLGYDISVDNNMDFEEIHQ